MKVPQEQRQEAYAAPCSCAPASVAWPSNDLARLRLQVRWCKRLCLRDRRNSAVASVRNCLTQHPRQSRFRPERCRSVHLPVEYNKMGIPVMPVK